MFEFVVDRLNVGDPDSLLVPDPRRRLAQHLVEALEHRGGELRPRIEVRRNEIGATFAPHTERQMTQSLFVFLPPLLLQQQLDRIGNCVASFKSLADRVKGVLLGSRLFDRSIGRNSLQ